MSVTGAIMAGVGLAGSIGSAAIGSSAAEDAAQTQANAADQAAQLQYKESQDALNFQKQQYGDSQSELAPFLQSGAGALSNLDYLLGISQPSALNGTATGTPGGTAINLSATPNTSLGGFGSLLSAYPGGTFSAPTLAQAEQMPGYQFQLQQGNQLLQQSAAARGNLLTGGTAEALDAFGQGLAQSNYQNLYNQALQAYTTNYNTWNTNQTNEYNRLAALAGMGQTTATMLGNLGQQASNNVTNNDLSTGQIVGQDYQNAGAANASGIVGSANAWGGAVNGIGSNLSNLALLSQLGGGGTNMGQLWNGVQTGNAGIAPISTPVGGYLQGSPIESYGV